jgi:hypothetical protein
MFRRSNRASGSLSSNDRGMVHWIIRTRPKAAGVNHLQGPGKWVLHSPNSPNSSVCKVASFALKKITLAASY